MGGFLLGALELDNPVRNGIEGLGPGQIGHAPGFRDSLGPPNRPLSPEV